TAKLNAASQGQIKDKSLVDKLEKEIKVKEQSLAVLHEELVILQSRLDVANDIINQQNQKIDQKNQQLTDLLNQLTDKDKLITNLQTEITNLKNPPTFGVNTNTSGKKIDELQGQLREKDRTIEELKNSNNGKESSATTYSQADLEKLIKEHQEEVQKLKALIGEKSQGKEVKMVQNMPVKEVIQQLPKKNSTALWLCLL